MRLFRSFLAVLAVAGPAAADEVALVPGSTVSAPGGLIRGKVERETPELVRIEGRDVPLDQVAGVDYDGAGVSYSQARLQENNGDLARAADLYQKAAGESTNPLVVQDSRFRRAAMLARVAQADPSKRDAAVEALRGITAELSGSRHVGPALMLLARLQLDADEFDAAEATLEELSKLPWARDRAAVTKSRVRVEQGQSEQAIRDLDALIGRLPEGGAARLQATLARAEALADLSRFEEAERAVRAVIDAAEPEDSGTLAPAYNTLGDCLRAAGKPRDALFAYLNTDILYPSQPEEHARALAAIAQLWRVLNQTERAGQVVDRLRQEYPGSPYLPSASGSAP
ncbi:tetratricopeptide repeat protein [Tautonia plasticadhaerens]|uniref:Tetratricopeptide repeat protein n=1 Tax=Tautonia plasticadhaerens TaxID=2527974 RepID=A0A518GXH6_9BACT|nr:tetratricopeptide repeat protein [Tautonia plasticadhaerens]QDV33289.1 Tetratricopeptide repeat protein [Tautonia plasticadhaerens]